MYNPLIEGKASDQTLGLTHFVRESVKEQVPTCVLNINALQ